MISKADVVFSVVFLSLLSECEKLHAVTETSIIIDNATADIFLKKFITKILSLIYFNLANRVYQIDNIFTSRYIYNS